MRFFFRRNAFGSVELVHAEYAKKIFRKVRQRKGEFMWQIVKSELKYYRIVFIGPIFFIILFQIMEFFIFNTISQMDANEIGYRKNAGYSIFILFSLFSILHRRIKEKRERFFTTLPLSNKHLAQSRFLFSIIPLIIFMIYFVAIHLIVKNISNIELNIPLLELGVIFILFVGFIRARDDWFSHWTFGKRIQAAFVSILITQIVVVALFLNPPDEYKKFIFTLGDNAEIIFYILGLVIMITTIFSYQKRKSYLT